MDEIVREISDLCDARRPALRVAVEPADAGTGWRAVCIDLVDERRDSSTAIADSRIDNRKRGGDEIECRGLLDGRCRLRRDLLNRRLLGERRRGVEHTHDTDDRQKAARRRYRPPRSFSGSIYTCAPKSMVGI